jgi:flagellar biogenesis protein FliO
MRDTSPESDAGARSNERSTCCILIADLLLLLLLLALLLWPLMRLVQVLAFAAWVLIVIAGGDMHRCKCAGASESLYKWQDTR